LNLNKNLLKILYT